MWCIVRNAFERVAVRSPDEPPHDRPLRVAVLAGLGDPECDAVHLHRELARGHEHQPAQLTVRRDVLHGAEERQEVCERLARACVWECANQFDRIVSGMGHSAQVA